MWKKYTALLLSLCLSCCAPPLVFSQSGQAATWESFDALLQSLRVEIEALSDSLTIVQSALDESQTDLQKVRAQSEAQAARLNEYENLLTQSRQSLLSYESRLSKSQSLNIALGVALIASLFGLGAALF